MTFDPSQLSPAPVGAWSADFGTFQDAAETTPAATYGQAVRAVRDQYGAGNDLNVSVGTPTLGQLGDGLLTVRTDNADYLKRVFLGGAVAQPCTLAAVFQHNATAQGGSPIYYFGSDAADPHRADVFTSLGSVSPYAGTQAQGCSALFPSPLALWEIVFRGATSEVWRDGMRLNAGLNAGTGTPDGLSVGNYFVGGFGASQDTRHVMEYPGYLPGNANHAAYVLWAALRFGTGYGAEVFDWSLGTYTYQQAPALCHLQSGKLLLAWSDTQSNQVNPGVIRAMTGTPNADGVTVSWGASSVIYTPPTNPSQTQADTSTGMAQLPSGRVLLPHTDEQTAGAGGAVTAYVRKSDDDGATWQLLCTVAPPAGYSWLVMYGHVRNPSGDSLNLLMPCYGLKAATGLTDSLLLQSSDGGLTWSLKSVIVAGAAAKSYSETDVVNWSGSNWLAAVRQDPTSTFYLVRSSDGGATWGAPTLFPFNAGAGVSPDFGQGQNGTGVLASGAIALSTCNRTTDVLVLARNEVRGSRDGGTTWSASPYVAYQPDASVGKSALFDTDFGYPSTVQLPNGRLFQVGYAATVNLANHASLVGTNFSESALMLPPPAPQRLATAAGAGAVALTWSAVRGATYNLHRASVSGGESLYVSGLAGASYSDSGVVTGGGYFYEVTAVVGAAESARSAEAAASVPFFPALAASWAPTPPLTAQWSV